MGKYSDMLGNNQQAAPTGKYSAMLSGQPLRQPEDIKKAQINQVMSPINSAADRNIDIIRDVNRGVGGLPSAIVTGLQSLYNIGAEKVGAPTFNNEDMAINKLHSITDTGKEPTLLDSGVEGAASALSFSGLSKAASLGMDTAKTLANPALKTTTQKVLDTVASSPAIQAVAGSNAGMASRIAKDNGAGTIEQTLAALLGGMGVPIAASAPDVAKNAIKSTLRGSDKNIPAMKQNIADFKAAGANASVGQASQKPIAQGMETLLSKSPVGSGVMFNAATKQGEAIGNKVSSIADKVSPIATQDVAGNIIKKGADNFVDRFKQKQGALYKNFDQYLPDSKSVSMMNTQTTLRELSSDIQGSPDLSQWFKNQKIEGIKQSLDNDLGLPVQGKTERVTNPYTGALETKIIQTELPGGTHLPYEALRKLRTLVGRELEDNSLVSDVPRSKWKALYAALSKDMEQAAIDTKNPNALKSWKRANGFTSAGHSRIETNLDNVVNRNYPEQIYQAATNINDMRGGASKINGIMKSLLPEERDAVRSVFIRDLGKAKAGQQDAEGSLFSSNVFLQNWNTISPKAKAIMFPDTGLRNNLDAIARVSQNIKEGSPVFASPDKANGAGANIASLAALGGAAGTASPISASVILTAMQASKLSAKTMTNPKFVQWLTTAMKKNNPKGLNSMVVPLQNAMQNENDDIRSDVERFLQELKANKESPN